MKPRSKALTIPDSPRYWRVDLGERGEHDFRFPSFAMAGRVVEWMAHSSCDSISGGVLYNGVVVGVCWWHRGFALDAGISPRSNDSEIDAFADAVVDELQEAGYTLTEIGTLGRSCDHQISEWLKSRTEAVRASADFTPETP